MGRATSKVALTVWHRASQPITRAAYSGFETQRETSPEVQNRGIRDPRKEVTAVSLPKKLMEKVVVFTL